MFPVISMGLNLMWQGVVHAEGIFALFGVLLCLLGVVFDALRAILAGPTVLTFTWIIKFLYFWFFGEYFSLLKLILVSALFLPVTFYCAAFTGLILQRGYKVCRWICPLLYFVTRCRALRDFGNGPDTFEEWSILPLETIKSIKLVLVPTVFSYRFNQLDARPEMDRSERFADSDFVEYHIRVEVRTNYGYRYYKSWVKSLPKMWYKENGKTLKNVVLNTGLIATALNRKTLMAGRDHPEVALDTMMRLISSNPHYSESFQRLFLTGSSVYRDMALVCGAIVTRTPYYDHQYF